MDGSSRTFKLRPWNIFSENFKSSHNEQSSEKPSQKGTKIPVWSDFADFVLSGLQNDDVEVFRDHMGKPAK